MVDNKNQKTVILVANGFGTDIIKFQRDVSEMFHNRYTVIKIGWQKDSLANYTKIKRVIDDWTDKRSYDEIIEELVDSTRIVLDTYDHLIFISYSTGCLIIEDMFLKWFKDYKPTTNKKISHIMLAPVISGAKIAGIVKKVEIYTPWILSIIIPELKIITNTIGLVQLFNSLELGNLGSRIIREDRLKDKIDKGLELDENDLIFPWIKRTILMGTKDNVVNHPYENLEFYGVDLYIGEYNHSELGFLDSEGRQQRFRKMGMDYDNREFSKEEIISSFD